MSLGWKFHESSQCNCTKVGAVEQRTKRRSEFARWMRNNMAPATNIYPCLSGRTDTDRMRTLSQCHCFVQTSYFSGRKYLYFTPTPHLFPRRSQRCCCCSLPRPHILFCPFLDAAPCVLAECQQIN